MSLSEPAGSDSPSEPLSDPQNREPSGNLPALYVSPWQEFGRNLQAMAADLRLRFQELWRRNRAGELSVPGFWPRDLAPSFWPLMLVLLVLLPVAGLRWWQGHAPVEQHLDPVEKPRESPLPQPGSELMPRSDLLPRSELMPRAELMPEPEPITDPISPAAQAVDAELALQKEEPSQSDLSVDPLVALFQDDAVPEGLLMAAKPLPEQDRLLLELSDTWQDLAANQRQSLAANWLQSALELDYVGLELVNEQGDVLGRSARVGGGMILFDLGVSG